MISTMNRGTPSIQNGGVHMLLSLPPTTGGHRIFTEE